MLDHDSLKLSRSRLRAARPAQTSRFITSSADCSQVESLQPRGWSWHRLRWVPFSLVHVAVRLDLPRRSPTQPSSPFWALRSETNYSRHHRVQTAGNALPPLFAPQIKVPPKRPSTRRLPSWKFQRAGRWLTQPVRIAGRFKFNFLLPFVLTFSSGNSHRSLEIVSARSFQRSLMESILFIRANSIDSIHFNKPVFGTFWIFKTNLIFWFQFNKFDL